METQAWLSSLPAAGLWPLHEVPQASLYPFPTESSTPQSGMASKLDHSLVMSSRVLPLYQILPTSSLMKNGDHAPFLPVPEF